MEFPDLPKKRNNTEARITPKVIKWFKENYPRSCALEIKVKPNKVLPHQDTALHQVSTGVFAYKIPDEGRAKKPFDAFLLNDADGILVTCDKEKNRWSCLCEVYGSNKSPFTIKL